MITLTAEQAQQIEEALEDIVRVFKFETGTPVEALAVIRAARAQGQAEQEPVAIVDEIGLCLDGRPIFNAVGKVKVGQKLYAAPVQQAEQEPLIGR